jgi:hypothetical protein
MSLAFSGHPLERPAPRGIQARHLRSEVGESDVAILGSHLLDVRLGTEARVLSRWSSLQAPSPAESAVRTVHFVRGSSSIAPIDRSLAGSAIPPTPAPLQPAAA